MFLDCVPFYADILNRRPMARTPPQDRQETSKSKKEDDDDNWDLPEGGLP